jgi:hypothetical protein
MICIYSLSDMYIIRILLTPDSAEGLFIFSKKFLPIGWAEKCGVFPQNSNDNIVYRIGEQELQEARFIHDKLRGEVFSGYVFSKELQRVYIVELVHLIKKNPHYYAQ